MSHSISNGAAKRTMDTTWIEPDGRRVYKKRKLAPEKSREARLAQNRKAAKESRQRKKAMIEELQKSLVFFSKANTTLKQQNEDLTRRLIDAKEQVAKMEGSSSPASTSEGLSSRDEPQPQTVRDVDSTTKQLVGPRDRSTAGRDHQNALELLSAMASPAPASVALQRTLPLMQPGATMQAMANFQQAAAAAMQAAAQSLVTLPTPALASVQ